MDAEIEDQARTISSSCSSRPQKNSLSVKIRADIYKVSLHAF